jgi:hypothetical protein
MTVWRDNLGIGTSQQNDNSPDVGSDDYSRWRTHFGQTARFGSGANSNAAVPEPPMLTLFVAVLVGGSIANAHQSHELMLR